MHVQLFRSIRHSTTPIRCGRTLADMLDFQWLGHIDYTEAWDLQRTLHAQVSAGERGDVALLLEHPPVYTAGRRTQPEHRPVDGTPVVDVDRGGLITWHGPGQLVGYPIVKLPEDIGVVDYIRRVEEALIRYLASVGIETGRVAGRAGVWLAADERGEERKIGQIGVRVAHKTSMHGFALNVDPDMTWFDRIVPCGITDAGVTSMARELGDGWSGIEGVRRAADGITPFLAELLSWQDFERTPDIARATPTDQVQYGLTV
ncbi:lipoate-protein ligase B [Enemella evansiae]|nr:lipoate-protein ligase B [Enemella evansiae]